MKAIIAQKLLPTAKDWAEKIAAVVQREAQGE